MHTNMVLFEQIPLDQLNELIFTLGCWPEQNVRLHAAVVLNEWF
jgi:hypothetical protein